MSTGNELLDVLIELTAAYTVERDALYESSCNPDGTFSDPSDYEELAVMNELIERAERVIVSTPVLQ